MFLAEDSPAVLSALKTLVTEIQHVKIVGCAHNVEQAERAIVQSLPDVVILDIRMPGGSGLDIIKNIRQNISAPPVIIVFSSEASEAYRRACLKLGADFFFDKASEFERVAEALRSMIDESAE